MKIRYLTALGGAVLFSLGLALALIDSFVFQTSLSMLSIFACALGALLAGGGLYIEILRLASAIAEGLLSPFARIPENATSITVRQAKALMKQQGALYLNGLTTLSDEAAKALAQHNGRLYLNGLTTLSPEAAKALSQHKGTLYLDGLTTLSDEAAKALSQHKGGCLWLNGLTTLSNEAAKALARHAGLLALNGLTTLSDSTAKALSQREGELYLNGLTTLSNEAAKALAQREGELYLNGLTTLSNEAAKALARHAGDLGLDGLTTLSDEAAKALSQHKGECLWLNGLTTLSPEVVKALAQHKGSLELNGLTTLSDEAAKALAQHKDRLWLNGLTTLSDGAAEALAQHKGDLSLNGLTTLSDGAAKALSQHEGRLVFDGLTTLTSASLARRFADIPRFSLLNLYRVRVLSDEAAKELSQHKDDLYLDGLTTLSNEAARALSRHDASRWLSLRGLTNLTPQLISILRRKRRLRISPDFERRRRDMPARVLGTLTLILVPLMGVALVAQLFPLSPSADGLALVVLGVYVEVYAVWVIAELTAEGYSLFDDDEVWYLDCAKVIYALLCGGFCLGLPISLIIRDIAGGHGFLVWAVVAGLLASVYIAPSVVASARNHPNKYAIMLLNYLAGWMFIPWVVALVWASLSLQPKDE
jgi:hypothetical protein